jgi:hypothetical protein
MRTENQPMSNEQTENEQNARRNDGDRRSDSERRWDERLANARAEAEAKAEARHNQVLEQIDELAVGVARGVLDLTELKKHIIGEEPKTFFQKAHRNVKEVAEVVAPYFFVGATAFALGKGASAAYTGTRDWWRRRQIEKSPVRVMPVDES